MKLGLGLDLEGLRLNPRAASPDKASSRLKEMSSILIEQMQQEAGKPRAFAHMLDATFELININARNLEHHAHHPT
eukprot:793690-Pelagomonas_calceolata.AAC.3